MRDVLSPTVAKNTVGMLRNYDANLSILLLEGESDILTLSRCIDRESCKIVVANNKTEAVEAVEFSDTQGFDGVLAIVDADLIEIAEERSGSPNVFYTDLYDLDAMVFAAEGIVERCVESICDYSRVHGDGQGASLLAYMRSQVVEMASTVGWLRAYSMQGDHQIPLSNFPFEATFNSATYEIDVAILKRVLIGKAKGESIDGGLIDVWIAKMPTESVSKSRVAQGHDLFRCLAYVVRSTWGVAVKADLWEKIARSHWGIDYLRLSALYREVGEWTARSGFQVWVMPN